jgi:hypothetical protein
MGNIKGQELKPSVHDENLLYGLCFDNGLAFRFGENVKNLLKTGYEREEKGGGEFFFPNNDMRCHLLPLEVDTHTYKKHSK